MRRVRLRALLHQKAWWRIRRKQSLKILQCAAASLTQEQNTQIRSTTPARYIHTAYIGTRNLHRLNPATAVPRPQTSDPFVLCGKKKADAIMKQAYKRPP